MSLQLGMLLLKVDHWERQCWMEVGKEETHVGNEKIVHESEGEHITEVNNKKTMHIVREGLQKRNKERKL